MQKSEPGVISPSSARRRLGALVVAACLLALVGCGDDAKSGDTTELPGIKEFGLTEEEYVAHIEETQALIASCMADAGFEYLPVDVKTIEAAQKRVRTEPGYTRRTFKEKWGLAVTTRFDNPVRDTGLGPNLPIWENLPQTEQDAYFQTLFGDDWNADFVFTFDEEDFSSTGGCTRKAVEQVFTEDQVKGTYVNPKDVLVEDDERIIEAKKNWSRCMHERGYEYEEDQDEIIEEYQERLEELLDGAAPRSLTGERAAALRKLQQEEIAVSIADMECQVKYTDAITREVEFEIFGERVSG
jgi:hypothetical protein